MKKTLELKQSVLDVVNTLGFDEFTPIQEMAIPKLINKQNVILKAPTGTGKTHAFLLPILHKIDPALKQVQAVILTPTRELAHQTEKVLRQALAVFEEDITVFSLIGGKDREKSIAHLAKTQPQILIGTPGRIKDIFVDMKAIDVRYIRDIVFDETDMIVENGFIEALDNFLAMLPNSDKVTFAVASATVSQEVRIFIKKYIRNIELIEVKNATQANTSVEHLLLEVNGKNKQKVLLNILETITPFMVIIFANTKKKVVEIVAALKDEGYKVGYIHGDLQPRERTQMLKRIHNLEFQYVVASDIAARGIDIEGASHVINYDIPEVQNIEFYAHRAGRTGRMNYAGTIISLYTVEEQHIIDKIRKSGIKFEDVRLKDNEFVPRKSTERRKVQPAVDAEREHIKAISKKAKRGAHRGGKVKPGYKKKIKYAVDKAIIFEKRKSNKAKRKSDRRSREN